MTGDRTDMSARRRAGAAGAATAREAGEAGARAAAAAAGKKRETGDERRAAIAAAARALIVEKGFEGLRTRDIAARVGINIATLHYHVPSKEALIELVAHSVQQELIAQDQAHPRDGMTPAGRLRQEIADFLDLYENHDELLVIMSEFTERSRRDPVTARVFRNLQQRWVDIVHDILRDGVADGSFRPGIDPETGAALFISAITGTARLSAMMDVDRRAVLAELERAFLNTSPPSRD